MWQFWVEFCTSGKKFEILRTVIFEVLRLVKKIAGATLAYLHTEVLRFYKKSRKPWLQNKGSHVAKSASKHIFSCQVSVKTHFSVNGARSFRTTSFIYLSIYLWNFVVILKINLKTFFLLWFFHVFNVTDIFYNF